MPDNPDTKPIELSPLEIARQEQLIDLLADHTASNERVVTTVERVSAEFEKTAERILAEHRQQLALERRPVSAPIPPRPVVREPPSRAIHYWGAVIALLILASGCIVYATLLLQR